VPYQLVGEELWARYTALTVEVFHKAQRVASHVACALSRSYSHAACSQHLRASSSCVRESSSLTLLRAICRAFSSSNDGHGG